MGDENVRAWIRLSDTTNSVGGVSLTLGFLTKTSPGLVPEGLFMGLNPWNHTIWSMSSAWEGEGHCSWPNYAPNSLNDVNNIM